MDQRKICEKLKYHSIVNEVLLEESLTPPIMISIKKFTQKSKLISVVLFTLLVLNLMLCVYQTIDRTLHYLNEPTAVDVKFNDNLDISFPYVYLYPFMTKELSSFVRNILKKKPSKFGCNLNVLNYGSWINQILKCLTDSSYISAAYVEMDKLHRNLTIRNYDTITFPAVQLYSDVQIPNGNNNYKIIIKIDKISKCYTIRILLNPSTIVYHIPTVLDVIHMKTDILFNIQKYYFVNTRRSSCDNNLDDCLRNCIMKEFTCRYPFHKARNLPECNNSWAVSKQFEKLRRGLHTSKSCNCKKQCDETRLGLFFDVQSKTYSIFQISTFDFNIRTLQEYLSYGLIAFFCDIGGSIGLFFGMSCLSLVEVFLYCSRSFYTKIQKTQKKKKLKTKIQMTLQKIKHKPIIEKSKIKLLVKTLLILVLLYFTYKEVSIFFNYPLLTNVIVVRDDIIKFPLIVVCHDSDKTIKAKRVLAKALNSSCEKLQLYDLLHESSEFSQETQKLFDASSIVKCYKKIMKHLKGSLGINKLSIFEISTAFGNCTAFKKHDMPFGLGQNKLLMLCELEHDDVDCEISNSHFILPQNYAFSPKHIFYPNGDFFFVDIFRQTLIRLNTPKRLCESNAQVSVCEQTCLDLKLKNQINCRLPFMKKNNLPLCTTRQSAKKTRATYLNIQFGTNIEKDCLCKPRCEENIFKPSVRQSMIQTLYKIIAAYTVDNDIREILIEERVVNIIKLLCNIGGISGIMIGLSTFSILEFVV